MHASLENWCEADWKLVQQHMLVIPAFAELRQDAVENYQARPFPSLFHGEKYEVKCLDFTQGILSKNRPNVL